MRVWASVRPPLTFSRNVRGSDSGGVRRRAVGGFWTATWGGGSPGGALRPVAESNAGPPAWLGNAVGVIVLLAVLGAGAGLLSEHAAAAPEGDLKKGAEGKREFCFFCGFNCICLRVFLVGVVFFFHASRDICALLIWRELIGPINCPGTMPLPILSIPTVLSSCDPHCK